MAINSEFAGLLNARPVVWRLQSSAASFQALVQTVLTSMLADGSLPKNRFIAPDEFARVLHCVLSNLLQVRYSDPTRHVSIPMATGAHREGFGYWAQRIVIYWLLRQKLITFRKGFRGGRRGYWSRIRGTDALAGMAAEHEVRSSDIPPPPPTPLIKLKIADKRVDWPADIAHQVELGRMDGNLRAINHCLGQCFIGLHVPNTSLHEINRRLLRPGPESSWIDFSRRQLYRVFTDDPEHGGRFYGGWWQEVPSQYRKHIHLAAPGQEPKWAVEFDFKSMHPAMLYARVRRAAPFDCYDLGGAYLRQPGGRDYAKQALLTLLNAGSREAAEASLRRYLMDRYDEEWKRTNGDQKRPHMTIQQMTPMGWPNVREILDRLNQVHAPIRQFFCTGVSKELMYRDSEIAEAVMVAMFKKHIPVLPVHDSFLVPEGNGEMLQLAMEQAFRDANGRSPCVVTRKRSEFDDFQGQQEDEWLRPSEQDLIKQINAGDQADSSIYWTLRNDWEAASSADLLATWPESERDPDDWD